MAGEISIGTIAAYLKLNATQFYAALTGAEARLETFGKAADAKLSTIHSQTLKKLTNAMVGIGVATGAGLGLSIDKAAQFQKQMELLHTQAGVTQERTDALGQSVLALANQLGADPTQMAQGLYHIVSVGVQASQQMDALRAATMLAKTGLADFEDTSNAVAGVLAAGFGEIKTGSDAVGEMNAAIGVANLRMGDLNAAISTGLLAKGREAGLTFQQIAAGLATLSSQSMGGAAGATRLGMTFALMEKPSRQAANALKSIGMTQLQLAEDLRKPGGLVTAFSDLNAHLKGLSETKKAQTILEIFGGGRSGGAAQLLLQHLDGVKQRTGEIARGQAAFGENFAASQRTAAAGVDHLKASLDVLAIDIGEKLLPPFTRMVQQLVAAVQWFERLSPATRHTAEALVAMVGGLTGIVGLAVKAAQAITTIKAGAQAIGLMKGGGGGAAAAAGRAAALEGEGAAGVVAAVEAEGAETAGLLSTTGPIALAIAALGASIYAWTHDVGHIKEIYAQEKQAAADDIREMLHVVSGNEGLGGYTKEQVRQHQEETTQGLRNRTIMPPGFSSIGRGGGGYPSRAEVAAAWKAYDAQMATGARNNFELWKRTHPASMAAAQQFGKEHQRFAEWSKNNPAAAATVLWKEQVAKAHGIGLAFDDALIQGIKGGIPNVAAAAALLARNLDNYLPHSDARVGPLSRLTASGRALARTFGEGIRSGAGEATSALDAVLGGIARALTSAAPGSLLGGSGSAPGGKGGAGGALKSLTFLFGGDGKGGLFADIMKGCFGEKGNAGFFGQVLSGAFGKDGRGGIFSELLQGIESQFGGGGAGGFGGMIGKFLGLGGGPLGSLVGGLIGGIGTNLVSGLLGHLFGGGSGPHTTPITVGNPQTIHVNIENFHNYDTSVDPQKLSQNVAWLITQQLQTRTA